MTKRLTRGEICFFTAYAVWLLSAVINLTYLKELIPSFKQINGFIADVVLLILLIKFLEDEKYEKKALLGLVLLGILFYVSRCSNAESIMMVFYFIYSARNIDFADILKISIGVQLMVMITAVAASLLGIIPNEIWYEMYRVRYSLGYTYCTYGSHVFLFLTLMYIALRKRLGLVEAAGLFAGNYIWFLITDTRIDLLLSIPAVLFAYIWEHGQKEMKNGFWERMCFVWSGPFIAVSAILVHVFFDSENPVWNKLNVLLNNRLVLGRTAIEQYGITFFGQYIKWVGRGGIKKHPDWVYNYVDSSYLKYLLHYGVFFVIVLLTGIVLAGSYLVRKEKKKGYCIAFLFWLLYGAVDAELFVLSFQPFILLCGLGLREAAYEQQRTDGKANRKKWETGRRKWRFQ